MPYKVYQDHIDRLRERCRDRRAEYMADKLCVDCGSVDTLEIDHLDPSLKISHRIWSWSDLRRETELAKCVVRCLRCHRERHNAVFKARHGTSGSYNRGCRCDACRGWNTERHRRWRRKMDPVGIEPTK